MFFAVGRASLLDDLHVVVPAPQPGTSTSGVATRVRALAAANLAGSAARVGGRIGQALGQQLGGPGFGGIGTAALFDDRVKIVEDFAAPPLFSYFWL